MLLAAGDKVHTFVSGCVPGRAAGTHLLDEVRVGALAGEPSRSAVTHVAGCRTVALQLPVFQSFVAYKEVDACSRALCLHTWSAS